MVLTSVQVEGLGEQHVEAWLTENGFRNITRNTKVPGPPDIQADGKERRLVRVRTAQYPDEPALPSADEIRSIKSRAAKIGRVVYVARVSIDAAGGIVGDIDWVKP